MTEELTVETTETPGSLASVVPEDLSNDDYRKLRETGTLPEPSAASQKEAESAHESETGEDNQEHDKQPKKGGFQRKIDKLTREKAELEARLAGQPAAAKPETKAEPVKAATTAAAGKPESKDFDTYEAFVEALTDWKAEVRDQAKATAAANAKAQSEAKAAAAEWNKQLTEARTRYDDFDDVALTDAPISEAVHNAIVGSERGADLAYFLGQNPAERERINALPPLKATLALGKILAALDSEAAGGGEPPEETKPKVSAAPPPIKPLGSKSAAAGTKRYDEMTNDEYRRARESGKLR